MDPEALLHRLSGEAEGAMLSRLLVEDPTWADPAPLIQDLRRRLDLKRRLRRTRELTQELAKAQAEGTPGIADLAVAVQTEGRGVRELTAPNPHSREDVRS